MTEWLGGNKQMATMDDVKLIDVTLRDGGYKNNFHFPAEIVTQIVSNADKAGIEYVEVGYRNGVWETPPNIGPTGLCSKNYLASCRNLIRSSKLTVMFHPKNLQKSDLDEMRACEVDCVRISFPVNDHKLGFDYIQLAKQCGFEVFVNLTHLSQKTLDELDQLVGQIALCKPNAIGLADSNGYLTPDSVQSIFSYLTKKYKVDFCFHAHDNLFLAQANAYTAIHHGAKYIDATFSGLGKGVGNLRMEGIVALMSSRGCMKYDLCTILKIADLINIKMQNGTQPLPMKAIIMGIFNISVRDHLDDNLPIEIYYEAAKQCGAKKIASQN